jgi:hypothetical protein
MEEKMTKELIEHTIEVDEYISATIKIPKVLSALDFKSLMVKADKFFKISEPSIVQKQPLEIKKTRKRTKTGRTKISKLTASKMKKFLLKNLDVNYGELVVEFNNKFNTKYTRNQIAKKVLYLKRTKQIKIKDEKIPNKVGAKSTYSQSEIEFMQKRIKAGKSAASSKKIMERKFNKKYDSIKLSQKFWIIRKNLK